MTVGPIFGEGNVSLRARRTHTNGVAFEILGQIIGADAHATGRRRRVRAGLDGTIDYPDGRIGAVAIALLGKEREFELASRFGRSGSQLAVPSRWKWVIVLSDLRELPRVRAIYTKIILTCETHDVTDPKKLPLHLVLSDADLDWVVFVATSSFRGQRFPHQAEEESGVVEISLRPFPVGSSKDDEIVPQLNRALHTENVAKRATHLATIAADERHLFLNVTRSALSHRAFHNLTKHAADAENALPIPGTPDLPDAITHLWLYSGWGRRVTRWSRGTGWDSPKSGRTRSFGEDRARPQS